MIALLALSTGAHARHPQYPPRSRPPAGSQCPVAELPAEEGSTQWQGITHFRDAGSVLAMDTAVRRRRCKSMTPPAACSWQRSNWAAACSAFMAWSAPTSMATDVRITW
ncbi:hypothetical protein [Xanthomonas cassavae]|uniref:hypothetical protein n=1 Tax=Xanthomonas cassavae TaxID=56450 RepID=UPI00053AEE1A